MLTTKPIPTAEQLAEDINKTERQLENFRSATRGVECYLRHSRCKGANMLQAALLGQIAKQIAGVADIILQSHEYDEEDENV